MKSMNVDPTRRFIVMVALIVSAMSFGVQPALAEDPIASDVPTAEVEEFLGIWLLKLDFMGRELEFYLRVADVDGTIGATLDSEQQPEPQAVDEITKTDEGLSIAYVMSLGRGGGGTGLTIDMNLWQEGDGIAGHIRERSSALFEADFIGLAQTEEQLDSVQGRRPNPTDTKIRLGGKKMIRIMFSDLEVGTDDHQRLADVQDGEIFKFTSARANKLLTDANLVFGDTTIKKENMAKDYPGVYSLWLKRVGDGWHLVFNEQPDIWGTRHDPSADVAEIPLVVSDSEEDTEAFVIKLEETGEDAGRLRMAWGSQVWTADFEMTQ